MRKIVTLCALVLFFPDASFGADQKKWTPKPPGQNVGDYGFGHSLLHADRIVEQLETLKGGTCCDGGKGGECRQTVIKYDALGKEHVLVDGSWCPVPRDFLDKMEEAGDKIKMPEGIEAVICSRKPYLEQWPSPCPGVFYCGWKKRPET